MRWPPILLVARCTSDSIQFCDRRKDSDQTLSFCDANHSKPMLLIKFWTKQKSHPKVCTQSEINISYDFYLLVWGRSINIYLNHAEQTLMRHVTTQLLDIHHRCLPKPRILTLWTHITNSIWSFILIHRILLSFSLWAYHFGELQTALECRHFVW